MPGRGVSSQRLCRNRCNDARAHPNRSWGTWAARSGTSLADAEGAALTANGAGQILVSRCATGGQGLGGVPVP
jgi:hypothetical protein